MTDQCDLNAEPKCIGSSFLKANWPDLRIVRTVERLLLVSGVLMLGIYAGARIHQTVLYHAALQMFKAEQVKAAAPGTRSLEPVDPKPDFSLWSIKRIKDYEDSLTASLTRPLGILRISKIHLEVPVFEGTDDVTLNRGVGRIVGTAKLSENGNIGVAGHRDGFFRGLKDIAKGDAIEVVTPDETKTYVVDSVVIVDPSDVSVLKPRLRPTLTLVTCYPFYFVGSAPQRYIVQASMIGNVASSQVASGTNKAPRRIGRKVKDDLQDKAYGDT